jgi:hypothetical protein
MNTVTIERIKNTQTKAKKLPKCSFCERIGHTAFRCLKRRRKVIEAKKKLKTKKQISPIGPMARKYQELRREFFKLNLGPHYCYYCLYIGIEYELTEKQTQVEHYLTKARHEKLRLDQSNLVKACAFHNKDKGGMDGPEYLEKLDKQMEIENGRKR